MAENRPYSAYFMTGFLACAATCALLAGWNCRHALETQSVPEILSGKAAHAYESAFDAALGFDEFATRLWGSVDYALFHEGKKGVVAGDGDWLFTSEEFQFHPRAGLKIENRIQYVASVQAELKARHIKLVVVPVPAKARLYAANYPSYNKTVYSVFLHGLRGKGIDTVDTLSAMEKIKEGLYLKTDTHWTHKGAWLAARDVAPFYQGKDKFETKFGAPEMYQGDLTRYTPRWGVTGEQIDTVETVSSSGKQDLFGDNTAPVALVGTSYSANPRWNFAGYLKEALHADVLNAADEGLGPFATMKKYLVSDAFKDAPPKLVVWEIPERYLAMEDK